MHETLTYETTGRIARITLDRLSTYKGDPPGPPPSWEDPEED